MAAEPVCVVLCASSDLPALWAAEGLRAAGIGPVVVTGEHLSEAIDWEHRIGAKGTSVSFKLPGGMTFTSSSIRGVLNRLIAPPQQILDRAVAADRDYALQEMTAFHLSWLYSLPCPVLNRPDPQGLSGRWLHASEAVRIAHACGLTAPRFRLGPSDPLEAGYASFAPAGSALTQVIVYGDEVFGASVPVRVQNQCVTFAKLARTRLVGIDLFATAESEWTFAYATPMPNLPAGGERLIAKIAGTFRKAASP